MGGGLQRRLHDRIPQGVANAIAAVPGIDALLIGTNDFCFECGIPANSTTLKSPTPTRK